jgi:PHS family inorganic phosphate transporter-like MFS transporter
MAEFANRRNRGRLVGLTFLFYVLGQVAAYLTALLVLAVGTPHDVAWRLVLGLGALPSLFVLWNRRHMPESPRWTLDVAGSAEQASEDLARFSRGSALGTGPSAPVGTRLARVVRGRRFLLTLLGTAGSWFFFNVAVYGNSVGQPLLIAAIAPRISEIANVAINACLVVCFSLTAAVVGLALLDRVRRKRFQIAGSALSALSMLLISAVGGLTHTVVPFAVVFGASLFGIAVGPNYTTMLLAAESYPTAVRSTGHGLSAGIAKIGAFVGALVTPLALGYFGLRVVTLIAGGCFLLGIVTTVVLPEPKDRALDDVPGGDAAQPAHETPEAVSA